jgi:hypothetical protein
MKARKFFFAIVSVLLTVFGCVSRSANTDEAEKQEGTSTEQVSNAGGSEAFDVNDISILFPLKRMEAGQAPRLLRLNEGQFMTQQQFENVMGVFRSHFGFDPRSNTGAMKNTESDKMDAL